MWYFGPFLHFCIFKVPRARTRHGNSSRIVRRAMSNKRQARHEQAHTKKTRSPRRPKEQAAESSGSLSHQECESMLEFYISSETRGENAAEVYPTVAQHLSECNLCK